MTTMMHAGLFTGVGQIALREVERQPPPPGYVVVAVKQSGICGSDLHSYFGHWNQSHTFAHGHETCGVVAEVGAGVTDFQLGDRVVIECFSHCGDCRYCRTGQYNHCQKRRGVSHEQHGGFAEYTTAHVSGLFKIPTSMSDEEGALVEPLAVGVRALAQAQATYADRVAIIGGGTIGLLCMAVAKANGVKETLITVKYPQQAAAARALGVDHVVDVTQQDVKAVVKELTGGLGMDVVIETVGGAQDFDNALAITRRRGTVVLVAGYHKPLAVDLSRIVWSEVLVTGSNCYGYSGMTTDFQQAIDLIASGKVDVTKIVTHRFPLTQITEAFSVAADKELGAVKVHLTV
ncbi:MAG: alcohol dehydrogenase catalytic domain-containing protein [Caldilineaceae bacterium]|nr:alcohol dehydrogenase catalytic domain-containing protein [Caldilineaceae bacterium]